jgi:hypothetical protein
LDEQNKAASSFVNQFVQKYVSPESLFFTCIYKLGTMSSKIVSAEKILKKAAKHQSQKKVELQKLITGTDHLLSSFIYNILLW